MEQIIRLVYLFYWYKITSTDAAALKVEQIISANDARINLFKSD